MLGQILRSLSKKNGLCQPLPRTFREPLGKGSRKVAPMVRDIMCCFGWFWNGELVGVAYAVCGADDDGEG